MSFSDVSNYARSFSRLPLFVRRAIQVDQMELDSALSQMYSICVNPSLVNKMSRARKATKNRFYRDDPAFVVLQVFFTVILSIAISFTGFGLDLVSLAENIVFDILSYGCWSILFTSAAWWATNKWLMDSTYIAEMHRDVDWRYSFDVHCNAYFFYFIWTRVLSFILLPFTAGPSFFACLLVNILFCAGSAGYFYNLFLGYLELPMLTRQQQLLYPIPLLVGVVLVATLFFGWNANTRCFGTLYSIPIQALSPEPHLQKRRRGGAGVLNILKENVPQGEIALASMLVSLLEGCPRIVVGNQQKLNN
eukprot:gene6083-4378_t